jgi:hypothetical protein
MYFEKTDESDLYYNLYLNGSLIRKSKSITPFYGMGNKYYATGGIDYEKVYYVGSYKEL